MVDIIYVVRYVTVSSFVNAIALLILACVVVWSRLKKRQARKRLVRAALAVINEYRDKGQQSNPQYRDRVYHTQVMQELIEATKHVN